MKNFFYVFATLLIVALISTSCQKEALDANITEDNTSVTIDTRSNDPCTTIQSGLLVDSEGNTIETGFDDWGYNYNAHMFNGFYCDSYRDAAWCQAYSDVSLIMKWNDAWLSRKDCDGDLLLDRHDGFDTYIGSGAWLTNHQSGSYMDEDGNTCNWTYFVKIVAAPADATQDGGNWVLADGTVMGPIIWGQFAIVQEVENDPCAGVNGLQFNSPDHSGLGGW